MSYPSTFKLRSGILVLVIVCSVTSAIVGTAYHTNERQLLALSHTIATAADQRGVIMDHLESPLPQAIRDDLVRLASTLRDEPAVLRDEELAPFLVHIIDHISHSARLTLFCYAIALCSAIVGLVVGLDLILHLRTRSRRLPDLELLEAATAGSDDGIIVLDSSGEITHANPAFSQLVGRPEVDLRHENIRVLRDVNLIDSGTDTALESTMASDSSARIEVNLKHSGGHNVLTEWQMSPVIVVHGRRLWACIVRDITERKRQEQTTVRDARVAGRREAVVVSAQYVGSCAATVLSTAQTLHDDFRMLTDYIRKLEGLMSDNSPQRKRTIRRYADRYLVPARIGDLASEIDDLSAAAQQLVGLSNNLAAAVAAAVQAEAGA